MPLLEARVDRLYDKLTAGLGFFYRVMACLAWKLVARRKLLTLARDRLTSGLREHGLL